jgi:hypothetical protein
MNTAAYPGRCPQCGRDEYTFPQPEAQPTSPMPDLAKVRECIVQIDRFAVAHADCGEIESYCAEALHILDALPNQSGARELDAAHAEIERLKTLLRLIEECSEVTKVACKSGRFGADYTNPATGKPNSYELKQECADLTVVMDAATVTTDQEFLDFRSAKRAKLDEWKQRETHWAAAPSPDREG